MPRILPFLVAVSLLALSRPAHAYVLKQIGDEIGGEVKQLPTDECRRQGFSSGYCYSATNAEGRTAVVTASDEADLRAKLAALKITRPAVPISGEQHLDGAVCRIPIAQAVQKNDPCLDHSYWGTQTFRKIGEQFAAAQKAHPGLALDWGTDGCGTPQVATFCVDVKDKSGKSLTEGRKPFKGDLATLSDWISNQEAKASVGAKAEAARKACPPADAKRSPRDLADLVAKKKENSDETGGLGAADFLMVCASQDTGQDLASLGLTRDKAQALMDLAKPKALPADAKTFAYSSDEQRQQLQQACKGVDGKAGDAAACGRFERLTQIEQLSKRCKAGETGACEKESRLVTQEELDKRPEVKAKIARAKAYGVNTDQAARYDSYVQRHFKDPKQQDLMERLMRANPETMGKLMEQNTQCEKTADAAACDKKFKTNYMGLADGRPVSKAGRQYLQNMCAMPENKDVEACKRPQNYAEPKKRPAAPPPAYAAARARPAPASQDPISALISRLMSPFSNSSPKGYVCRLKGTDIACSSAGQAGCECRELR